MKMGMKIFLGLSVLLWLPYGVYCVINPGYLAGVAGVTASTPTGTTEIRAMYGGLQAALGVMSAFALIRPAYSHVAATALCFAMSGLFLARFIGFVLDASGSEYTYGALVFELSYAMIAGLMARRSRVVEA